MNLKEVKLEIEKHLPIEYWSGIWSRSIGAGIEIGVNLRIKKGSIAALLPIADETRKDFAKFLALDVLKYESKTCECDSLFCVKYGD